jgi:phenylpyruvate tautomerase PptA (4-oxalocrotonate tautomerase family)
MQPEYLQEGAAVARMSRQVVDRVGRLVAEVTSKASSQVEVVEGTLVT